MIKFKYWVTVIKKFWFINKYLYEAKMDFYDENGFEPGETALEMLDSQAENAWKLYTQGHQK